MDLSEDTKGYLIATAGSLKGAHRRLFMARTVRWLGSGGQRQAERQLGWNRGTILKGTHELLSGIRCVDHFCGRGRKRAEEHLPRLLQDITAVVDGQSQTDPSFRTQRLYTRLTPAVVRQQLLSRRGYAEGQLPSPETIRRKMRQLGYRPTRVAKCRPKKR
jgi:hypothetical protein